jgi:chemotaxis protein MotA
MLVVVGALVVIGAVMGGYLMEGGHPEVLIQPAEFIIIGGAMVGSLLISTSPKVLKMIIGSISGFFASPMKKDDYLSLLAMLYELFRIVQQSGIMGLEMHFENVSQSTVLSKYPKFLKRHHAVDFLSDSVKVIMTGGILPHDLEALMDEDLHIHHEEALRPANALQKVGDALPGLGIVAAVLGVVITMGAIDGPPSEIGHKVGAALVGTFLGILLSYGFVQPLASNIEASLKEDSYYTLCIKAGLLASYKGFAPAIAVEFARRVIPSDVRPSFDETEQYCRGLKAGGEHAAAAA